MMESSELTAMELLRKAVIAQKSADFPHGPVNDPEIDAARVRLETYAQLVTTLVIQVLQGGQIQLAAGQDDPDLDSELSALHQNKPAAFHRLIERLRQHKERLDSMLELAIRASGEANPK